MSQKFQNGDFLVFQLEAGFALLRLLDVDEAGDETIWHLAAYEELFPDIDSAESATSDPSALTHTIEHLALTNRAFESTQVARISNSTLTIDDTEPLRQWKSDLDRKISDRSVRLMLGLR